MWKLPEDDALALKYVGVFNKEQYNKLCGPGSSVGIATGYGLNGPGIESRWGEIFCTCLDRPLGSPSLLYNGYRVFPGGRAAGAWCWPLTPFWCHGKERVELHLYSPYGPYGLYKASVPVQGCTLPYLLLNQNC